MGIASISTGKSASHQEIKHWRDARLYQMGWEGRSPAGCDTLPMKDVLKAQKRRPAMKKI